jgi:hypothetical protein
LEWAGREFVVRWEGASAAGNGGDEIFECVIGDEWWRALIGTGEIFVRGIVTICDQMFDSYAAEILASGTLRRAAERHSATQQSATLRYHVYDCAR